MTTLAAFVEEIADFTLKANFYMHVKNIQREATKEAKERVKKTFKLLLLHYDFA